ncbi:hypothetical protein BST96_17870 [Oceanicoccus sagamiensis]|uniref:Uncharacterized protein n=1 Tax=Oceanicoccus sagamiensis TaxID=716816 RepID=A0A1X9NF67_9GAMM|nr:hypothetical protein BST96_17870 [Oceanicoccus sagamiensis]
MLSNSWITTPGKMNGDLLSHSTTVGLGYGSAIDILTAAFEASIVSLLEAKELAVTQLSINNNKAVVCTVVRF